MRRTILTGILALGLALPSLAEAGRIRLGFGSDSSLINIKLTKSGDSKDLFAEGSTAALGLAELLEALENGEEKKLRKKLKKKIGSMSGNKAKFSFGTEAGNLVAKLSKSEMRQFLAGMRSVKSAPDSPPTGGIPEPGTAVLMASGLLGLAGANARIRRKR